MTDLRRRVHEILAEQALLNPSEVSDDKSLADLGIDSMGIVEVIFAIEEEFQVSVPFNANKPEESGFDISSVGAIVAALEDLIARGQA